MNLQQRRIAAISMAVRNAIYTMGLAGIRRSEFFGMKQQRPQTISLKEAAQSIWLPWQG